MTKVYVVTIKFGKFGCVRGKRNECLLKNYDVYTAVDIAKTLIKKYKIDISYYSNDMSISVKALDIITNEEVNSYVHVW